MNNTINSMLAVFILSGVGAMMSCTQAEDTAQQAADKRVQAEADCARLARDKPVITRQVSRLPAVTSARAQQLVPQLARRSARFQVIIIKTIKTTKTTKNKKNYSNNTSTKVVQGAAVGAAAGAGIGAISDNEKKKAAASTSDAYQREYQNCLQAKGF